MVKARSSSLTMTSNVERTKTYSVLVLIPASASGRSIHSCYLNVQVDQSPRGNKSQYIGGHHLVHEYIGGELQKPKNSFRDPSEYFGSNWNKEFERAGYGTAICGRVGNWDPEAHSVVYNGHLLHLTNNECGGYRMRSRFWLGEIEGVGKWDTWFP